MKLRYTLLLVTVLAVGLISCKKGNSSAPISGKWQQTKLRLYETDSANRTVYDTTYLAPFTNLDYVQFNADGTCTTSSDHYYYPNYLNYPKTPQAVPQSVGSLAYSNVGSNKYILSSISNLTNPGGFVVTDSVFVNGNSLVIHVTNYGHGGPPNYKGVSDAYYER